MPKDINVEPKIFGPLTFKDVVIILIVGAGLAVLYFLLQPLQFLLLALPIGGATVALMFVKVNGRPFMAYLEALFHFTANSQVFLWKREGEAQEGVEHIFHIITEAEPRRAAGLSEAISEAPQSLNPAQRKKIDEIAKQLDEAAAS